MITGLGFGLEDTGLGLGLEDYWPWPRTCCPRTHSCQSVCLSMLTAEQALLAE